MIGQAVTWTTALKINNADRLLQPSWFWEGGVFPFIEALLSRGRGPLADHLAMLAHFTRR
jgi:hypothetical protein